MIVDAVIPFAQDPKVENYQRNFNVACKMGQKLKKAPVSHTVISAKKDSGSSLRSAILLFPLALLVLGLICLCDATF